MSTEPNSPAIDRAYTVDEIDRMRKAVAALSCRYVFGKYGLHEVIEPTPGIIEDRLRTYMLGGVEPSDLEERAIKVNNSIIEESAKYGRAACVP